MLKVAQPALNAFHNFKCGEIFCISSAVFNVTCCLCADKVPFLEFPSHFQLQHLALIEESINLEELECKNVVKSIENESVVDNVTIKEEDPIKDEYAADLIDKGKFLEVVLKTENTVHKSENLQQSTVDNEVDNLNKSKKLKVKSSIKKVKKRNSKRSKNKVNYLEEIQDCDEEDVTKKRNSKRSKKKVNDLQEIENCDVAKVDLSQEDDCLMDFDNDDSADKDWTQEDKAIETESEADKEDNFKDALPFSCNICDKKAFRTKHGLLKHTQIVHNPKTPRVEHKCDECSLVFRTAIQLVGHKRKHTGIFCDICGKPFTQMNNMMQHKKRHTGIKNFKCEECGKDFFTRKELTAHKVCHTNIRPVICEICGKQCRHRGILTAHMRRHTGERPAKCDVCGKSFYSFHDLNIHAVAHTSERLFRCDICDGTFQRRKALRVHKLIHSKDRKHVCKICGKGFAQSGGLKSHMRSHDAALEKSNLEFGQQAIITQNAISLLLESQGELNQHAYTTATTSEVSMPQGTLIQVVNFSLQQEQSQ